MFYVDRFIEDALQRNDGKILVHCMEGFRRSATIVLAHMIAQGEPLVESLTRIRRARYVSPNEGFVRQLVTWALQHPCQPQASAVEHA